MFLADIFFWKKLKSHLELQLLNYKASKNNATKIIEISQVYHGTCRLCGPIQTQASRETKVSTEGHHCARWLLRSPLRRSLWANWNSCCGWRRTLEQNNDVALLRLCDFLHNYIRNGHVSGSCERSRQTKGSTSATVLLQTLLPLVALLYWKILSMSSLRLSWMLYYK